MSQPRATSSEQLHNKVRQYALQYGIFRPESALIIALTAIAVVLSLTGTPWMPGAWWMWLIGGLIAEAAIIVTTLRDERLQQQMIHRLFSEQFNTRVLRSAELRQKVAKALEYRELLVTEIERRPDPMLDAQLSDTARGMEEWVEQIYRLALGIDAYLNDPIIEADMQTVPQELAQYEARRVRMQAGPVQEELDKTISLKRAQLDAMNTLRDTMTKARLQLDNTLTAMSTIYMQAKMIGSKDVRNTRAQRLQAEMLEQVNVLRDTSATMDEIYQSHKTARAHMG